MQDANELIYKTELDIEKKPYGYQREWGRDKLGVRD